MQLVGVGEQRYYKHGVQFLEKLHYDESIKKYFCVVFSTFQIFVFNISWWNGNFVNLNISKPILKLNIKCIKLFYFQFIAI